jgi:hypothetical protein
MDGECEGRWVGTKEYVPDMAGQRTDAIVWKRSIKRESCELEM